MAPPTRLPLNTLKGPNNHLPLDGTTTRKLVLPGANESTTKSKPIAKAMPAELLDDFKRAIEGSDLTKAGLVEVLKKK